MVSAIKRKYSRKLGIICAIKEKYSMNLEKCFTYINGSLREV